MARHKAGKSQSALISFTYDRDRFGASIAYPLVLKKVLSQFAKDKEEHRNVDQQS
jgi:hypothetical protein